MRHLICNNCNCILITPYCGILQCGHVLCDKCYRCHQLHRPWENNSRVFLLCPQCHSPSNGEYLNNVKCNMCERSPAGTYVSRMPNGCTYCENCFTLFKISKNQVLRPCFK